jgi:hypothetical protein
MFLEGPIMASEAQVTANRLNAAKSTGPRTPQGKEIVAQNALKHGLLARRDVIAGEDQEEIEKNTEFNLSLAVGRTVALDCWKEKVLDRLQLYERRIESSLCRIMRELEHLGRRRKPEHAEGAAVLEASGLPIRVEGAPRVADETPATQPPTDCAEQSQFMAVEGGHRPPCETGEETPAGQGGADSSDKAAGLGDGSSPSQQDHHSEETQNLASPTA